MPRVCCALLAFALLAPAAPAAALEAVPLPVHAWAVEFGVAGASLTSFDGGTITLRHQTSEHAAWRYAATFSGSVTSGGRDLPFGLPPSEALVEHQSGIGVVASLTRLTCVAPKATIKPYLGLGAGAGWKANRLEQTTTTFDPSGAIVDQLQATDRAWGPTFDVSGVFGLEWALNGQFALHAEYGEFVSYTRTHTETESSGSLGSFSGSSLTRSWSFGDRRVLAGVSVFY